MFLLVGCGLPRATMIYSRIYTRMLRSLGSRSNANAGNNNNNLYMKYLCVAFAISCNKFHVKLTIVICNCHKIQIAACIYVCMYVRMGIQVYVCGSENPVVC